ncbi:MAG: response regulator, partial [Verrucomicrobiae bacterium]|nr:response regulator [Verrucomicrobiae bacterium]
MKVLLVEDHQPTTQIVLRTLASCGHQAEICFSAEEAIDLLKERGVQAFDAFILDLKLPGMDGITLCRWIRIQPEGEAPYIIVGTGSDHSEELGNAFDAGADDYVEKPYQPKILGLRVAVAAEHIVARQERNRLNHELNREKDFIAAVFDTAAAFIVALNRDEEVVKINQACEELTEIKGSNFDGQHFCDLLLSKDVDPRPIRDQLRSLS